MKNHAWGACLAVSVAACVGGGCTQPSQTSPPDASAVTSSSMGSSSSVTGSSGMASSNMGSGSAQGSSANIPSSSATTSGTSTAVDAGNPTSSSMEGATSAGTSSASWDAGTQDGAQVGLRDGSAGTVDAAVLDVPDAAAVEPVDAAVEPVEVGAVEVTPAAHMFTAPGQTQRLTPTFRSSAGQGIPAGILHVEWVSTNPAVVSLSADPAFPGAVLATSNAQVGSAVVVARVGTNPPVLSDPVLLTVVELEVDVLAQPDLDIIFPRLAKGVARPQQDPSQLPDVISLPDGGVMVGPFALEELQALLRVEEDGNTLTWQDLVDRANADAGTPGPADAGVETDAGTQPMAQGVARLLGGSLGPNGGFMPQDQTITSPQPELGPATIPVVVLAPGPAVGTVLVGDGLQPLAGRVVSVVERQGYALVALEPVMPDALFKQVDLAFSLGGLRDLGLLSPAYERAFLGSMAPVGDMAPGGPCQWKGALVDVDPAVGVTHTFTPVLDVAFAGGTSLLAPPQRVLLRFGMTAELEAVVGLKAALGPAVELECTFTELGSELSIPLPGFLGAVASAYVGRPQPFVGAKLAISVADVGLTAKLKYARNLIVGAEFVDGVGLLNRSDLGATVTPGVDVACTVGGLPCAMLDAANAEAGGSVAASLEGGLKLSLGVKPASYVEHLVKLAAALADKSVTVVRLKALEGKAALTVGFEGDTRLAAMMDPEAESAFTAGLGLAAEFNLAWATNLLKRVHAGAVTVPVLETNVEFPLVRGPGTQLVSVRKNQGAEVIIRDQGTNKDPLILVQEGDVLRVRMELLDEVLRAPRDERPFFLSWLPGAGVTGVGAVDSAAQARTGAGQLLTFPQATNHVTQATWTVPPGFCSVMGQPAPEAVSVRMANVWEPWTVPVGSTHAGTFRVACGTVGGKVAQCDAGKPSPNTSVSVVGDCGFRQALSSDAMGAVSVDASAVPGSCTTLWLEVPYSGIIARSLPVALAGATFPLDLGTVVLGKSHTSVSGIVEDEAGAAVAGASVSWDGEQVQSQDDGSFQFPSRWAQCSITLSATKGTAAGFAGPFVPVVEGDTPAGRLTLAAACTPVLPPVMAPPGPLFVDLRPLLTSRYGYWSPSLSASPGERGATVSEDGTRIMMEGDYAPGFYDYPEWVLLTLSGSAFTMQVFNLPGYGLVQGVSRNGIYVGTNWDTYETLLWNGDVTAPAMTNPMQEVYNISPDGRVLLGWSNDNSMIATQGEPVFTAFPGDYAVPNFINGCKDRVTIQNGSSATVWQKDGPGAWSQAYALAPAAGLRPEVEVRAFARNGALAGGYGYTATYQARALLWDAQGVATVLAPAMGETDSLLLAMSADGTVAGGYSSHSSGEAVATVWREANNWAPETLAAYLAAQGVTVPAGITSNFVTSISANGKHFLVQALNSIPTYKRTMFYAAVP